MKNKQLNEQINRIKSMMKSIHEGVFDSDDEKRIRRRINSSSEIEIPYGDEDYLYPIFKGYCRCESGEFGYEYGGVSGTHDPGMDCMVEDVLWNKEDFSEEENNVIQKYFDENSELVNNRLMNNYMKNIDPF